MIFFDLRPHEGWQRPKTPLGGQNIHEGVNLWKKVFNESFSATSKTPQRIQSDLSYDLRQERYSDLRGHSMYIAVVCTQLLGARAQKPAKQDSQFCKSKHRWLCAQKVYKLRQTNLPQFVHFFSRFDGTRKTPNISHLKHKVRI